MVRQTGTLCLDPSTPEGQDLLRAVNEIAASVEVGTVHEDGNINFLVVMR